MGEVNMNNSLPPYYSFEFLSLGINALTKCLEVLDRKDGQRQLSIMFHNWSHSPTELCQVLERYKEKVTGVNSLL